MKTVFSKTNEVAAIWAAQVQEEARTGSNTWCRRASLGSYGTIIATIVPSKEGKIALVSERSYSASTAIVIGQGRSSAFKAGMIVFCVKHVGDGRYEGGEPIDGAHHMLNLDDYVRRIDLVLDKIAGAKRFNGQVYRSEVLALIGEALLYARVFKLKWAWKGRNPFALRSRTEEKEGW